MDYPWELRPSRAPREPRERAGAAEGARRSGLWAEIGPDRARARGMTEEELEEYYRTRNLLKARITAGHVAKAVCWLARREVPITGVTLPVDGGLPEATPR